MDNSDGRSKSEKLFLSYLLNELGIPEDSIATNYRLNKFVEVDVAIIDQSTNLPIMIFEVKSQKNHQTEENARKNMRNIAAHMGINSARMYIAYQLNDGTFDIDEINAYAGAVISKEIDFSDFDYKSNRNAVISETVKKKVEEKGKAVDNLSIVSWIMAGGICAGYIIMKILGYILTANDLAIVGVIIGLVLLPFANKIKILGVEYERYIKS